MKDPQAIWDNRYSQPIEFSSSYDNWLEPWKSLFAAGTVILDLGCGRGYDSEYLLSKGCTVIASDFSKTALSLVHQNNERANVVQADLRQGLPFSAKQFQVIIASLSLHYLPWQQTSSVIRQIRDCLIENGVFLARFNSTNDINYGARGHRQLEKNYRVVDGELKRFFDRETLGTLFEKGWRIDHLEEKVIHRFGKPKAVWEIATKKIET